MSIAIKRRTCPRTITIESTYVTSDPNKLQCVAGKRIAENAQQLGNRQECFKTHIRSEVACAVSRAALIRTQLHKVPNNAEVVRRNL